MAAPPVGSMLLGKYRIERVLGTGGMGVVVAARHLGLDEVVAIKMLSEDDAHSAEMYARFLREAKATARLRSAHVVRVSDVGRLETGIPYMVMELLTGRDLGKIVREDGPQPAKLVATVGVQICEALAEAHELGIVHRDLKGGNLFMTKVSGGGGPHMKVLDFGIAKTQDAGVLTRTGAALGTPSYMAPEQLRSSRTVDARADIWSLGVVLYELLEGRRPFGFPGITYPDLCVAIETRAPAPMLRAAPELQQAVLHCLQKDPAQRTSSMIMLARALSPFLGDPRVAERAIERIQNLVDAAAVNASAKLLTPAPTPMGRFGATASMSAEPVPAADDARTVLTPPAHTITPVHLDLEPMRQGLEPMHQARTLPGSGPQVAPRTASTTGPPPPFVPEPPAPPVRATWTVVAILIAAGIALCVTAAAVVLH